MGILNELTWLDYAVIIATLSAIIGCISYRKTKVVKDIVYNAVIEAERRFNSGEGQAKMDFAIKMVQSSKLPFVFKLILTKRMLVTLIELLLNTILKTFELAESVDIKGNDVTSNYTFNKEGIGAKYTYEQHKNKQLEPNSYIYGEIEGKTDFKGNESATVKVGLKKKL